MLFEAPISEFHISDSSSSSRYHGDSVSVLKWMELIVVGTDVATTGFAAGLISGLVASRRILTKVILFFG